MTAAVVVVLVVLALELVVGGVLLWQVRALRARMGRVDGELGSLESEVAETALLRRASPHNPLIAVEILNSHELAARESWAARRFGTLVPRLVGREVAARAAQQLAEQLAEQGVRAEVRVVDPQRD